MKSKATTLIIYPPGGSGTFVDWFLSYFTGAIDSPNLPFKKAGNSHLHSGLGLDFLHSGMATDQYLNSDIVFKFARCHAATEHQTLEQYYKKYAKYFQHIVILNPTNDVFLFLIQSAYYKIPHMSDRLIAEWNNFSKGPFGVLFSSAKISEQREILSFWYDKYSHYHPDLYDLTDINPHTIKVNIKDLLKNPKTTLNEIIDFLQLSIIDSRLKEINDVLYQWQNLQEHKDKDTICNNIIEYIINDLHFDWSQYNLNIFDEAYIQWQLRHLHNINLKCYNLEVFPTNTKDLKNIIE